VSFLLHSTQNLGAFWVISGSVVNSTAVKGMHGSMKLHSHSSPDAQALSPLPGSRMYDSSYALEMTGTSLVGCWSLPKRFSRISL
jgi:hypothetical protein